MPDYFTKAKKYVCMVEARPLPEIVKQRADWTIRYIKNGEPKKVVLMEDKRRGKETTAGWKGALDQLTRYMKLVRTEKDQDPTQTLYGVVNIGTYTRFYKHEEGEDTCDDYPHHTEQPWELCKHEKEIHSILEELVRLTSH